LKDELIGAIWASFYFFLCLGLIVLLKKLFLAQYSIAYYGLSIAILVVNILEKFYLGYLETGGLSEGIKVVYESWGMNRFLATNICVGQMCLIWALFPKLITILPRMGSKRSSFP
jgi:hypothetical protein